MNCNTNTNFSIPNKPSSKRVFMCPNKIQYDLKKCLVCGKSKSLIMKKNSSKYNIFFCSSHGFRLYKILLILAFFLITASFKGVLLSFLTITILPKPMDTLQEVAASVSTYIRCNFFMFLASVKHK